MKFALATAAVVMGQSIPVAHSRELFKSVLETGIFQDVYEESPSGIPVPESKSLSRRAQQTISEECIDEIDMRREDIIFNTTNDAMFANCATNKGWINENATFTSVGDFRTCDTTEMRAFCDANYQTVEFPDLRFTCELEDIGLNQEVYIYDFIACSGKSCPSDPVDWLIEDYLKILTVNSSQCTVEVLEEGEEPPQQPSYYEGTLSQECTDEIDILFEDAGYKNATGLVDCPAEVYRSDNDTVTIAIRDFTTCDLSNLKGFCDANYQSIEFQGNMKATCPGNVILYAYGLFDCVGTSCPSNPADWLISDMSYLFSDSRACDFEFLEEGEEPPPRPNDPSGEPSPVPPPTDDPSTASPVTPPTDDPSTASPVPPPTDDPSTASPVPPPTDAASGLWLPWTITLLPVVATTLAFYF